MLKIFRTALLKSSYKPIFQPIPLQRGISLLQNGSADVELARIDLSEAEINDKYIKVKYPIAIYQYGIYSFKKFHSLQEIDKIHSKLGIVLGSQMNHHISKQFKIVNAVTNRESLREMLDMKRIDLFAEKKSIELQKNINGKKVYFLKIAEKPVYTYVRKDFKAIVPYLERQYQKINLKKNL